MLIAIIIFFALTLMFTSVKCAMSIFINNIPVSINFFAPFTPSSLDKPLAVLSIQLDLENRLIQRNWTFTVGFV